MKLREATYGRCRLLRMFNLNHFSSFFSSSGIYREMNSSITLKKGHLPSYIMPYYT